MFFRIQVFEGIGCSWSRFFKGPGFSGSESRARVQVLEVAKKIDYKKLLRTLDFFRSTFNEHFIHNKGL